MIDRTPRPSIAGIPVPEREEVRNPDGLLGSSTPLEELRRAASTLAEEQQLAEATRAVARYAGAPVRIWRVLDGGPGLIYRITVTGVPGHVDVPLSDQLLARSRGVVDVWQTFADAARRHRFAHTPDVEDHIERGAE